MAAGDITRDSGSPEIVGNRRVLTGTIEVDGTDRAFALTSTASTLVDCMLVCEGGEGTAQVRLNQNTSGTTTNGTVRVQGNHQAVATYRYRATII